MEDSRYEEIEELFAKKRKREFLNKIFSSGKRVSVFCNGQSVELDNELLDELRPIVEEQYKKYVTKCKEV